MTSDNNPWVSLEESRPNEDEWVETALLKDGQIEPIQEGYVEPEGNDAWRHRPDYQNWHFGGDDYETWEISHWRYPLGYIEAMNSIATQVADEGDFDDSDPFADAGPCNWEGLRRLVREPIRDESEDYE